jgi:hypothetical protein
MKEEEIHRHGQNRSERQSKLKRRALNQLAYGFLILLWGSLLIMKEAGIIARNVSTWPIPLAAFGLLLIAGGVYRLSTFRASECKNDVEELKYGRQDQIVDSGRSLFHRKLSTLS